MGPKKPYNENVINLIKKFLLPYRLKKKILINDLHDVLSLNCEKHGPWASGFYLMAGQICPHSEIY